MTEPSILEIHSHSTVSDGKFTPPQMAQMMTEAGVELWALTDHDTVDGVALAKEKATEAGVAFVPGIEISAELDGNSIHVLGYGYDPETEALRDYGGKMVQAREDRMATMAKRMTALGFAVTLEDVLALSDEGNVGRPHMAQALVEKGYVDTLQDAFDRWLALGQPGYVPMTRVSVDEAISMIVDAGGMAVLAHPARYGDISEHLAGWRAAGLWGLEVRHPSHNISAEDRLIRLAERFELGKTASNDWHGSHPDALKRLGGVRFPEEWRRPFLERLRKTHSGPA